MSFEIGTLNGRFARHRSHWRIFIALLIAIAPASIALADQVSSAQSESASQPTQAPAIDPVTGLVYTGQATLSGVAVAVDADGHPRALCTDPTDLLAPLQMRDAIDPASSRLRYE